jgi:hypothetical protein
MDRRRHAETVVGGMSLLYWQFLQAHALVPISNLPAHFDGSIPEILRRFAPWLWLPLPLDFWGVHSFRAKGEG